VIEEVLDWRPPDYITTDSVLPMPNAPKIRMTDRLTETATGTRLTIAVGRPRSVKDRAFVEAAMPDIAPLFHVGAEALQTLLADEMARRAGEATVPEPDVPVSAGRNISEPVDSSLAHSS
jgi:hypothetical protein